MSTPAPPLARQMVPTDRHRGRRYDKRKVLPGVQYMEPVAPVAYQVILEPGVGQFREFESPRVYTRINSWGLFLVGIRFDKSSRA